MVSDWLASSLFSLEAERKKGSGETVFVPGTQTPDTVKHEMPGKHLKKKSHFTLLSVRKKMIKSIRRGSSFGLGVLPKVFKIKTG